jgi:phenazine biosynthesis protein
LRLHRLVTFLFFALAGIILGVSACSTKTNDNEALRQKNMATVKKYAVTPFVDGVNLLFAEDGTFNGVKGKAALLEDAEFNTKAFPDWQYTKFDVFSTQDPNKFFVEAKGQGHAYKDANPAATPGNYSNSYILVFIMKDGKIESLQEHQDDQFALFRAFGYKMPEEMTALMSGPPKRAAEAPKK